MKIQSYLLAAAMALAALPEANAAVALFEIDPTFDFSESGPARGAFTDGPLTVGNLFQVGDNDILINALGVQDIIFETATPVTSDTDSGADFYTTDGISVGIWRVDAQGGINSVVSAVVLSSNALGNDGYRYISLGDNSVQLAAGAKYLIGAYVGSEQEGYLASNGSLFTNGSSNTQLLEARFIDGESSLTAPTRVPSEIYGDQVHPTGGWAPANALFTVVPEPTSCLLIGGSLFAAAAQARRRRG